MEQSDRDFEPIQKTKHKGKHDEPKPLDDSSIDHWKIEKFDPSWNEGGMLEVSSFSTLFPKYREKYLQEVWPIIKGSLKELGVACELNLVEGSMSVSTTMKTRDPYIIIKARDMMKLLSRSVPVSQAIKILGDEMQCDIIKIGNLVRNKDRFVKRRQYLIGPNYSTLKDIGDFDWLLYPRPGKDSFSNGFIQRVKTSQKSCGRLHAEQNAPNISYQNPYDEERTCKRSHSCG